MSEVPSTAPSFESVVRERMSRRGALKAMLVVGGGAAGVAITAEAASAAPYAPGELTFDAIALNTTDAVTTPTTFKHDVLISWGDPVVPGAPSFDIDAQTAEKQAGQFGFNNDYTDYKPLPYAAYGDPAASSDHGLLWVNHEYTSANMMFPGLAPYTGASAAVTSAAQKQIEIEAHGGSIVEVSLDEATNTWSYSPTSTYNRRITGSTPIAISGPAAGNVHLRTNADPTGTTVKGMLNNCGGGSTPWGTILTAEENFDQYFANRAALVPAGDPLKQYAADNASVFGIPAAASARGWELVDPRFDMVQEWNEPFRFGWIVEVDPYEPTSTPKKRTALGRFKHEAASGAYDASGKWVIYMGDDQAGQFVYKFVTTGTVDPANRAANADLLDSGTLYVATFNADGTGVWKPLVHGSVPNPPAPALPFEDQADVLIRTRTAAAVLGGTPMDRPEDIDVSPTTGYVYIAMTGTSRTTADAANPRVSNAATDPNSSRGGHVIELRESAGQAGTTFTWEILLLCGTPGVGGTLDATTYPAGANSSGRTYFGGFDETQVSPITRPDNLAFDTQGNLFITTDGQPSAASGGGLGMNDTAYGVPVEGAERGHLKALVSAPPGAEMTGPYFTPDDRTLFLAIQHPGEDGSIALPQATWNAVLPAGGGTCSRNAVLAVRRVSQTAIGYGTDGPTPIIPEFPVPGAAVAAGTAAAVVGGLIAFRNRRPGASPEPSATA
jgi:uncharacterized protein